ncbi:MtrAB system accessory lipoprotein LpqB [Corynebacterium striatum]
MSSSRTSQKLRFVRSSRSVLAVTSAACVFAVAGCSTLPHNTSPQVVGTFQKRIDPQVEIMGPKAGADADLVLREFYTASGKPASNYESSRNFLADSIAETWDPTGSMLVVDSIDILTVDNGADRRTFDVRGNVIGSLVDGGAYVPRSIKYEATIKMEKINDQWRIVDLPAGLVIERNDLRNNYRPLSLYFFGQSEQSLVSDRRWLYTGQQSVDTELVTLLLEGPNNDLRPAISDLVPVSATFLGKEDGTYRFSGMNSMSQEQRLRFAASLVWTLNNANVGGKIKATADGSPLIDGLDEMTIDDFAEYNPGNLASSDAKLYAINNGALLEVSGGTAAPSSTSLGRANNLQSADISAESIVAAVQKNSQTEYQLKLGKMGENLSDHLKAKTIARPTFEPSGQAIWTVVNGEKVVRVARSAASGEISQSEVDTSGMDNIKGEISVIRLSATGARVAMLIGGNVYIGIVARGNNGDYHIVNAHQVGLEMQNTALSLDWMSDGSLLVGTNNTNSPVWRIEQDGSSATTLASGNITAPVVAVAASPTTLYITDSHALLQLPAESTDNSFWREVSGLQGLRSSPIVAK